MKKILLKFKAIPIGIGVLIFNCLFPAVSKAQFTILYNVGGSGSPILVPNGGINVLYGMTGGNIFKINTNGTAYSNLHTFQGVYGPGGGDGENAQGSLVYDGSTTLYGMTQGGGVYIPGVGYPEYGTRFTLDYDGSNYSGATAFTSSEGINPYGSLIIVGGTRYGMTNLGGANAKGTIWSSSAGPLHSFAGGSDGAYPYGDLVSDGTYLYGMTPRGGLDDKGVVFKYNLSTNAYSVLLEFGNTANGAHPYGSLIFVGGTLYGMTTGDYGTTSYGNIFKITTSGTYTHLYAFISTNGNSPRGSLIYDKGFLFGMTEDGGVNGLGTLFKVDLTGSNYVDLVNFDGTNGSNPKGSLCSDGLYLYGMTSNTIFKYNYCSNPPLTIANSAAYTNFTGSANVYPTITFNSGITAGASKVFKYANTATLNGPFSSSTYTLSITPTPCP